MATSTTSPEPPADASRKPRLKDVAQRADVSVATASMALADHPSVNVDTKRRVREVSEQLGYRRPGQAGAAGKRRRTTRFGVMIVGEDTQSAIYAPIMMALAEAGQKRELRLEYDATPVGMPDEAVQPRALQFAEGLDGLLLTGFVTPALLKRLHDAGVPHVVLGHIQEPEDQPSPAPIQRAACVAFDELAMGRLATRHLLARGHQRIAFVGERLYPGLSHDQWRRGYQLAHLETGVALDPSLTILTGTPEGSLAPAADTITAMAEPPTAYSIPDGRIAAQLIAELRERGRAPEPNAIIFESIESMVGPMGLSGYPRLSGRIDLMARHGLHQLERISDAAAGTGGETPNEPTDTDDPAAVQVYVPFQTHDLT